MSFLDLIFCVYRFCELDFLKTTGTTSFVRRVPFVRRSFPFLSRDISSATRFFYIDIWRVLFFPFGALVGRNFFRNLFDKRLFTFVPRRTNDRTFSFILRIFFLFFLCYPPPSTTVAETVDGNQSGRGNSFFLTKLMVRFDR